MKQISKNFQGHYHELILGPLFKLLEAVLELMVPLVMARIIDTGILNGDERYVLTRGLMMLSLGILGFGAAMVCQYYAVAVSGAFGRSLRNQTYAHVMQLSGADVAEVGVGGLITRLTNDINQIQTGINMAIRLGGRVPFLAIGSIVMAMHINPRIGLIFLVSTPLIILILCIIMRKTLPGYSQVQGTQDRLSQQSAENLAGTRVIRAFSRQEDEKSAYEKTSTDLTKISVHVGTVSAALNPMTNVIANAAVIAIVWFGAKYVFSGKLLTGEIIALVNYMLQTLLALVLSANLIVLFTRALASARRVAAVLDTAAGIQKQELEEAASSCADSLVSFEDVQFAYHKGAENALEDISFCIRRGEVVGLIGGTGSGKSTVASLLMRYYDVDGGAIRMSGAQASPDGEPLCAGACGTPRMVDIRAMEPAALRLRIGYAPQKAVLFAGSIRHNLLISAPECTEEEMWHALEVAQCADFVRKLPQGLDSPIQEGGKNLSGGQRQRLTVARALARRPELLILDDAASALDYATDASLRRALQREKQARPDMAMLIISQRAASLLYADQILVLDDGRLVGKDTHAALLCGNEVYREICHSQGIETEALPGTTTSPGGGQLRAESPDSPRAGEAYPQ